MSDQPTNRSRRRGTRGRSSGSSARTNSLWRSVPPPGTAPEIEPTSNATKLIESLDALPLRGNNTQYYVAAVIERAAGLAVAVAASAGLLAVDGDAPSAPD
jgi:hypothetical protein